MLSSWSSSLDQTNATFGKMALSLAVVHPLAIPKRLWHVVADMTKARPTVPAISPEPDPLVLAVDRLTSELAILRQVMDEIREDFSWLTRNGLPIQPIEHIHVKRMALDPCAADWGYRLQIERSTLVPNDSVAIDRIADDLKTTFEAIAQGQLEVVLQALDGVRGEVLAAVKCRSRVKIPTPPTETAPVVAPPDQVPEQPRERPPRGRMF